MGNNLFQLSLALSLAIGSLLAGWRISWWRLKRLKSSISGTIEVFRKYNGEKLLTINHYPQGISTNHPSIKRSYWYRVAQLTHRWTVTKRRPQVLLLGLGANTISSLINQLAPQIHQTIVEIDPIVINICRQFFNLDALTNYTLTQADAFKLLNRPHPFPHPFDVIIVDLFTGPPPFAAIKSNQPVFIAKLLPQLKSSGLVIFNHPAHTKEAQAAGQNLRKYLTALFRKVRVHLIQDPRGYRNYLITAHSQKSFAHLKDG